MTHIPKDTDPARFLAGLNREQREAVTHTEGPQLVLAGAGSGKTRVLTHRIAHLVEEHGIRPKHILALTFTNKAAGEMRERVGRLLGHDLDGMWIGTFHSFGARVLRSHAPAVGRSPRYSILDADAALRQVRRAMHRGGVPESDLSPADVQRRISDCKNRLISAEAFSTRHADAESTYLQGVRKTYLAYEDILRNENEVDFDDLLALPVRVLAGSPELLADYQRRYRYILVDEYQDTNRAQYRMLAMIGREHRNVSVVGDDDQSIYGWRGADIRNIIDFEREFPGTAIVRLEQNYRSTGLILDAANEVIKRNEVRKGKRLRTENERGDEIVSVELPTDYMEADWIAREVTALWLRDGEGEEHSCAILYRTNAQSRALEEALLRHRIPHQIVGGTHFYDRREVQDVLAYLRLVANPRDGDAFARVVNYPKRGLGKATQEALARWADDHGTTMLEAAHRADEIGEIPATKAQRLADFAGMMRRYTVMSRQAPVHTLIEKLVEEVKLLDALAEEGEEGQKRQENVRELVALAEQFDPTEFEDEDAPSTFTDLDVFIQKAALVADTDQMGESENKVSLMTIHAAKGLEFRTVFLAGMEEGLFPSARAIDDPRAMEEERRLFYVGITRAEERLYMTRARHRRRYGTAVTAEPSQFLAEVPEALVRVSVADIRESAPREAERAKGSQPIRV